MTAPDGTTLDRLFETIGARGRADPATSYTAKLLRQGTEGAAQKLGEEALETALAAVAGRRAGVVSESADLLYHLLVLWAATGVTPAEVWAELARREGTSGLAEKAQRPPQ
jgi:phosphoribosyl-ATP pyrophosphohydrolase